MKRGLIPVLVFMVLALGLACGQSTRPAATQAPAAPAAKEKVQSQEWQRKWDNALSLAKQEGQVMVYGALLAPRVREAMAKGLEGKYNIKLEFISGSAAEIATKWDRERNAGVNLADIFMVGSAITVLNPLGALGSLEPYLILPEVLDGKAWPDGKLPYLYKDKTAIPLSAAWTSYVAINTDQVKEGQLSSYKDLLKPQWKEKIAINDPTVPGAAAGWAAFMITDAFGMEAGKEFLRQLAATKPLILKDPRQLVEWVARGKYPIGIGAYQSMVSDFKSQGAPINFNRFIEGGNINPAAGTLHVSATPRSPNATTIFINWMLTAEGQRIYAAAESSPPVRLDVKVEGIDPVRIAPPGGKVFWANEEFYSAQGEAIKFNREIFTMQ